MPTARIDTPGVTIELTASEVSIEAFGKQAMDMFKEATEVNSATPPGPAAGFTGETRYTADHKRTRTAGHDDFGSVQA
jgi:hypothetical protein